MLQEIADFQPTPLHLTIAREDIEIGSLDAAIHLLRSLRHDRLGGYAEMLLMQMEAAKTPYQQADAWIAFRTWSSACGLHASDGGFLQAS